MGFRPEVRQSLLAMPCPHCRGDMHAATPCPLRRPPPATHPGNQAQAGTGKKLSCRARNWGSLPPDTATTIAKAALEKLVCEGKGAGLSLHGDEWTGFGGFMHKDVLYFRFDSCRLSKTCVLSCGLRDWDRAEMRGVVGDDVSASSFALVHLQTGMEHMRKSPEDTSALCRHCARACLLAPWPCFDGLMYERRCKRRFSVVHACAPDRAERFMPRQHTAHTARCSAAALGARVSEKLTRPRKPRRSTAAGTNVV